MSVERALVARANTVANEAAEAGRATSWSQSRPAELHNGIVLADVGGGRYTVAVVGADGLRSNVFRRVRCDDPDATVEVQGKVVLALNRVTGLPSIVATSADDSTGRRYYQGRHDLGFLGQVGP